MEKWRLDNAAQNYVSKSLDLNDVGDNRLAT
jgi:hypothetical protein